MCDFTRNCAGSEGRLFVQVAPASSCDDYEGYDGTHLMLQAEWKKAEVRSGEFYYHLGEKDQRFHGCGFNFSFCSNYNLNGEKSPSVLRLQLSFFWNRRRREISFFFTRQQTTAQHST